MTRHARITAFGSAAALIAIGIACAIVLGGLLGPVLAFIFIASGLVLATSLVFLEVGLSEDRARDRELARARRRDEREARRLAARTAAGHRSRLPRLRGHRREL